MFRLREYNLEVWKRVDEELANNKYDVVKRLEEAASEALEEMLLLAKNSKSDAVRMKASQDLMDRDVRLSRTKRVEGVGNGVPQINIQVLQAAALAMKEEQEALDRKRQVNIVDIQVDGQVQ